MHAPPDRQVYPGLGTGRGTGAGRSPQDGAREAMLAAFLKRLAERHTAGRPMIVLGAPGAGATHLLRVGLAGAVRTGAFPAGIVRPWEITSVAPDLPQALRALRAATGATDGQPVPGVGGGQVIVLDHLEELLAVCGPAERYELATALAGCAARPDRVVVCALADAWVGAVLAQPGLAHHLADQPFVVPPMDDDELRAAVVGPASVTGVTVDEDLVEIALRDVCAASERYGCAQPLLFHTLARAWAEAGHGATGRLLLAHYDAAGGIEHALERTDREVLRELDPAARAVLDGLLLRLVRRADTGTGPVDMRGHVSNADLDGAETRTAQALLDAGLLIEDGVGDDEDSKDGRALLRLAHPVLLTAWPRLRALLEERCDADRLVRRVTADAHRWTVQGRDPRLLPAPGERIRVLADRRWLPESEPEVAAYVRAVAAVERRALLRRRGGLVIAAGLVALSLVLAGWQVRAAQEARLAAGLARLTAHQLALSTDDISLSAQLAAAVHQRTADAGTTTRLLATQAQPLWSPLRGHQLPVAAVAYRPGGRLAATASHDDTVQLWNVDPALTPGPVGAPLTGHGADLQELSFSADGSLLVSADRSGGIRVWDLSDPARPTPHGTPLAGHDGEITAVALSRDNGTLLSTGVDGTLRMWDVALSRAVAVLRPEGLKDVYAVAFSADARLVAYASGSTVRVARIGDDHRLVPLGPPLTGLEGSVRAVRFAAPGGVLAAGDATGDVRLWRLSGADPPTSLGTLVDVDRAITALSFQQDGTRLAIGAADGMIRVWNVSDPANAHVSVRPLAMGMSSIYGLAMSPDGRRLIAVGSSIDVLLGDLPPEATWVAADVTHVALSPDGATLATFSTGAVHLWDMRDRLHVALRGVPLTAASSSIGLAWSRTGNVLALADATGVQLWDVTDTDRPRRSGRIVLPGSARATCMALSPDGRTVAVGEGARVLRFDMRDPARPVELAPVVKRSNIIVTAVAFDLTGQRLAAGDGYSVRVWDLARSTVPTLAGDMPDVHTGNVLALVFTPDGRLLASGGNDAVIRLWDVSRPGTVVARGAPLLGNQQGVPSLAVSPDSRTLASAGDDGTVRLWDLTTADAPGQILGRHGSQSVRAVAFSPTTPVLVSGGRDNSVVLWDLDADRVERRVCASTAGVLARQRWDLLRTGLDYTPPCTVRTSADQESAPAYAP